MEALQEFMKARSFETEDTSVDIQSSLKQYTWQEEDEVAWKGDPPKISILVDESFNYLLSTVLQVCGCVGGCVHVCMRCTVCACGAPCVGVGVAWGHCGGGSVAWDVVWCGVAVLCCSPWF